MNIIMEDTVKGISFKETYIGTFSTKQFGTKIAFKYPLEINPFDAEKMLQMLIIMCHHPKVYAYFKEYIPSPFFVNNDEREQYIPLKPLLNYLAGPSKINCLNWNENNVEYYKGKTGIIVRRFSKGYLFPYNNEFSTAFLQYFGMNLWESIAYKKEITEYDFGNAYWNLSTCLSNFTTWFISSDCYDKLCIDLRNICITLEQMLDQNIFKWNDTRKRETNLLYIMTHRLDFKK